MKLISDLKFGFFCSLRGIQYLFSHASLMKLAAIPITLNIFLFLGLFWVIYHKLGYLIGLLVTKPEEWYWVFFYYGLVGIAFLLILIIGTFFLCLIGNIIAAPFHEWMAEKVKELEGLSSEKESFSFSLLWKEAKRIVATQFKKLVVILFLEVLVLTLVFIPAIGAFFSGILTLILLAFQFIDFPLEVERLNFTQQKSSFFSYPFAWIGFGAGMSFLLAIPVVNFFMLPAGAVGASLLYYQKLKN